LATQILRVKIPTLRTYVPPQPHCSKERAIDRMIDPYIALLRLEQSSTENTRIEISRHTYDH